MKSFKEYLREDQEELLEKLITFGGKAYPKFGNVVIMAGGAGSGKGFVKDNLVGVEGIVFDVDELKKMAIKSIALAKKVKDNLGIDLKSLDLAKEKHVGLLHDIIANDIQLTSKKSKAVFKSVMSANPDRKPNLIFDVTLKNMNKVASISNDIQSLGYDKKNIHIVWVVNDIEVAKNQNKNPERGRVVPIEILVDTHRGVSQTMNSLLQDESVLAKYMDGDLVFAFNKIKVDSALAASGRGGQYIKDANYVYVKRQGKRPTPVNKLEVEIRKKIAAYVPKNVSWV